MRRDRTRNETSIGNLRELSPSPPPPSIQPEALLGSLQQLDTKIATLCKNLLIISNKKIKFAWNATAASIPIVAFLQGFDYKSGN